MRLQRLEALTKDRDRYITTEVGQHQMWAAQYLGFEDPNRWMTSGGLGTMGYGFPAPSACRWRIPKPGDQCRGRSIMADEHAGNGHGDAVRPARKQFILNNERLGMVRQWQELLHGERYSQSWSEALPDFVKLAEAFGAKGILCSDPADLDRRDHGDAEPRRPGDL